MGGHCAGSPDADAGESAEHVVGRVLFSGLGLPTPGRDLPHHLLPDHADLVDHDEAQVAHLLLELQERGAALCELVPLARVPHLEEAMQRRRGEADVERGAARRRGDPHVGAFVVTGGEEALELLEQRLHGRRLPGPGCPEEEQAQGLHGPGPVEVVEDFVDVFQHDLDEEALEVVAELLLRRGPGGRTAPPCPCARP